MCMKRKAIQLAHQTLVISLPSKWVKQEGIEKGDEIDISQSSHNLVISKQGEIPHKKLNMDLCETGVKGIRIIDLAFKAGYDEIEVRFSSHEDLRNIDRFMRVRMPTFNIKYQTKNSLIIEKVYNDNSEKFSDILKRFLVILDQIAHETLEAFKKNDSEWLKQIILIQEEPDRLANILRRNINLDLEIPYKRPAPLYVIIEMLLFTAGIYREICSLVSSQKIKPRKETIRLLGKYVKYQEEFFDLFYGFSIKKSTEFHEKRANYREELKLFSPKSAQEKKLIELFSRLIESLFELDVPLVTLKI